jgi:iron complex transport system permease protein
MKHTLIYVLLLSTLCASLVLSLSTGAVMIPLRDLPSLLTSLSPENLPEEIPAYYHTVLYIVRMPRIALALLIGATLGISGAAIQAVFRNALAEPGLIGISSGASLGAVTMITLENAFLLSMGAWAGYYLISFGAFIGAVLAASIIYRIAQTDGRPDIPTMLLAGIAINAIAAALTGLITANAEDDQIRTITFWMLGSLTGATWQNVTAVAPFVIAPLIVLPFYGKSLNLFTLGEHQAEQLGVNTARLKKAVILLTTLAVGASVAVSGVIGFVGLLVPHLIRLAGGVDNRFVIPASALGGALILTIADLVARLITAPVEQPIGVITALMGAPLFLYLLIRDKKKILNT